MSDDLKTITVTIISKGRIWIAAKINGYDCKIKIDENSSKLEPGEHEIFVKDISIRSKYGTEIRYELVETTKDKEKIFFKHEEYNSLLLDECKRLGGKWDDEAKVWVFLPYVKDEVENLEYIFNSPLVGIDIKARDNISVRCGSVKFYGYSIVRAKSRDSGAFLAEGVSLIEGTIDSGGSVKNWETKIYKGTVLRLQVPKNLLTAYVNTDFDIKILEKN